MALTNFGELKQAVADWIDRPDLAPFIPDFVALCEDRIAQDKRLRIRPMETSDDLVIDALKVPLSPGYLTARRLYLDGTPRRRIEFLTPENFWIRHLAIQTGQPKFFTVEGENIVFGPAPDKEYTGKFLYYKRFDPLVNDEDTNWLLTNARGVLLYGSLLEAMPFIKDDPRLSLWATMWDQLVDQVKEADKRDRFDAGAPLMIRSDVQVDSGTTRMI